jgi:hypothetical protein
MARSSYLDHRGYLWDNLNHAIMILINWRYAILTHMSVTVVVPTCQWDTNDTFPNCENYNGIFPSNPFICSTRATARRQRRVDAQWCGVVWTVAYVWLGPPAQWMGVSPDQLPRPPSVWILNWANRFIAPRPPASGILGSSEVLSCTVQYCTSVPQREVGVTTRVHVHQCRQNERKKKVVPQVWHIFVQHKVWKKKNTPSVPY